MKSLTCLIVLILIASSCADKKNAGVTCTFNDQMVTISNASATIQVDNDLCFRILFKKEGSLSPLTAENNSNPSIFLRDSINERISFVRKTTQLNEIKDQFGKGEKVKIEAVSHDGRIKCNVSLSSYCDLPDVILVQSVFINISGKNYFIRDYTLDQVLLQPPPGDSVWWSFQGASYNWGNDFAFKLPESFSRENYMGLNAVKTGGGLPLADVWNREFGLALACLGDKPCDISLPVKAENGKVGLGIKEIYKDQILKSGDSLVSVLTAVIIHRNDFYDPVRMYSKLMKPFLPDFLKPVNYAYQPEWCTWGYRRTFKSAQIVDKLEQLKAIGMQSVIIDDGWSVNHGDWIPDPEKFPGGDEDFKFLISKIHRIRFKSLALVGARLYRQHIFSGCTASRLAYKEQRWFCPSFIWIMSGISARTGAL